MKFIPLTNTFKFDETVLTKEFLPFSEKIIRNWILEILNNHYLLEKTHYVNKHNLKPKIIKDIQIAFRENFPEDFDFFFLNIFVNPELMANFLSLCLQNYCNKSEATELENILSGIGSMYTVSPTKKRIDNYELGCYILTERLDSTTQNLTNKALKEEDFIREAMINCYSTQPDYGKSVANCQDELEKLFKENYEPNNKTPQFGKILKALKEKPEKLNFKGSDTLDNKEIILDLIKNISKYRGIHKAGTGINPTKKEAEYFIYTTIYLWTIHRQNI